MEGHDLMSQDRHHSNIETVKMLLENYISYSLMNGSPEEAQEDMILLTQKCQEVLNKLNEIKLNLGFKLKHIESNKKTMPVKEHEKHILKQKLLHAMNLSHHLNHTIVEMIPMVGCTSVIQNYQIQGRFTRDTPNPVYRLYKDLRNGNLISLLCLPEFESTNWELKENCGDCINN